MPDCDVAVVGAGVIGEAIAYELVTRGAEVTLLDSRGSGLGSTQASAGMLVPYLEGIGRPLLPLAARSLEMYDGFVERVSRDTGMTVGYRRTGSLQVVTDEERAIGLRQLADDCLRAGIDCEFLDRASAKAAEPQLSPDVTAGLLVRPHGFVVPTDLSGALIGRGDQTWRPRARAGPSAPHIGSGRSSRGSSRQRRGSDGARGRDRCWQLVGADRNRWRSAAADPTDSGSASATGMGRASARTHCLGRTVLHRSNRQSDPRGRDSGGCGLRRARDRCRRSRSARRRMRPGAAPAAGGLRRARVSVFGRLPRTRCRSSAVQRRCRRLSTRRVTIETACCWRLLRRAQLPTSFSTTVTIRC